MHECRCLSVAQGGHHAACKIRGALEPGFRGADRAPRRPAGVAPGGEAPGPGSPPGCLMQVAEYQRFLTGKLHYGEEGGFAPQWMPDFLFPFQSMLVEWAIRRGRCAIFADCGMGKTPM